MTLYMVVGLYGDGGRFADSCEADSADHAEEEMLLRYDEDGSNHLVIAGVLTLDAHGEIEVVA